MIEDETIDTILARIERLERASVVLVDATDRLAAAIRWREDTKHGSGIDPLNRVILRLKMQMQVPAEWDNGGIPGLDDLEAIAEQCAAAETNGSLGKAKSAGLMVTRKPGQSILLDIGDGIENNDGVRISVISVGNHAVRLQIYAPEDVLILRAELEEDDGNA